jgi:hypothetical protein
MKIMGRSLVPEMADVEHGPPIARIIPFTAGVMACGLVVAYFLGLPTASSASIPMFLIAALLLASLRRYVVATGYSLLAVACAVRGISALWVDSFLPGQVLSALVGWGWMATNFVLSARMVMARGVRRD